MRSSVQDHAPETLLGLVQRYSPSRHEESAVRWLVPHMDRLGFSAFSDRAGNAVGVAGQGPRQLVLLGHIDTVPGEIPPRLEEGKLYGRGVVDAKGSLSAFVDATAASPPPLGWQYVVIGAVGEEEDSRGARYVVSKYRPQLAIIGEPSRWERVTLGYRGSTWLEVQVQRASQHAASGAESACEAAVGFWSRLRALCDAHNARQERIFDRLSATLREMNSQSDGLQDTARLGIDVRLPPGITPSELKEALAELKDGEELRLRGASLPAYQAEKNTPLVGAFLTGIRAHGGQPAFVLKAGTSDMNVVGPSWRCPIVAYGPGDSKLDHTPHEHLSLAEYWRAVDVLAHVLAAVPGAIDRARSTG